MVNHFFDWRYWILNHILFGIIEGLGEEMTFDFGDFIEEETKEEKATLEYVTEIGEEATALKNAMDELQSEIDMMNVRFRHITEKDMPRCLQELGMKNFTLKDGTTYQIKEFINGSLDKAPDREKAIKWCEDNGLSELFTVDVNTKFSRGGHNEALALKADLEQKGFEVDFKEGIHHSTFSAQLRRMHDEYRENQEQGIYSEAIPFAELGAYCGVKAEIKKSRKK